MVVAEALRSVSAFTSRASARSMEALLPTYARVVLESLSTDTAALTPITPPAPAVLRTRDPVAFRLPAAAVMLTSPAASTAVDEPTKASVVLWVMPTPTAAPMPTAPPAAPTTSRSSWVLSDAATSTLPPAVTRLLLPMNAWVLS